MKRLVLARAVGDEGRRYVEFREGLGDTSRGFLEGVREGIEKLYRERFDAEPDEAVVVVLPWVEKLDGDQCRGGTAEQVAEVFEHWQAALTHPRSKLDANRRQKIRARLTDGFTVEELKRAVDGMAAFPFVNQGRSRTGAKNQRYDDITIVCQSAKNVERFMELAPESGGDVAAKLVGA